MSKKVKDESQQEQQNVYKMGAFSKLPSWFVSLLLKYWAAAAAVFFSVIGGLDIGLDFSATPDDRISQLAADISTIVVIGLVLGLFMNYIVKPVVHMFNSSKDDTYRTLMVNQKGVASFFISLAYNMLLSIILYIITVFLGSKGLILNLLGGTNYGIEPFTYALCYLLVDFVFLTIKNLIVFAKVRHDYNAQMKEDYYV